jgi:glucokinase
VFSQPISVPNATISQSRSAGRLVADIGGTNARFAWQSHAGATLSHASTLKCSDFGSLNGAIAHYLSKKELPSPHAFGLGIATPVFGDQVQMTNHHWSFSINALKTELGSDTAVVVNDFVALASAIPALTDNDVVRLNDAPRMRGAPIAVIGAGTGLGVASLIADRHGEYHAVPGEGGHVTLAATNDEEDQIIRELRKRFGHVSAERALSGPGLVVLYEAHCALRDEHPKPFTAAEITSNALGNRDFVCSAALSSFTSFLGNVSGNLALTLGAFGGLYIGGGIVPKLGSLFDRARFLEAFTNKGRFEKYLGNIPCGVITCESPALIGAARVLQQRISAQSHS